MTGTNDTLAESLMPLWAKLPKETAAHSYHPLICHLIDVAMVTRVMWDDVLSRWTRRRVSGVLGLDEDAAGQWITFFSGSHDIGKGCPAFQLRDVMPVELRARIEGAGLFAPKPNKVNHGAVSTYVLKEQLSTVDYRVPRDVAEHIAISVGGHHGTFPGSSDLRLVKASVINGGETWARARHDLLRLLAGLINLPQRDAPQSIDTATAMWLAGLVSVADWIGSNEDFFHHEVSDVAYPSPIDVADYRDRAEVIARKALRQLGWLGTISPPQVWSFHDLFPKLEEPAPVQREVVALAEGNVEPALVVVEAPMGEGKTEAALYLADHWDASLGQHGFYVALPTQATSNQMYGRVKAFLKHRYAGDVCENGPAVENVAVLQLLHGHAALSGEFAALLRDGDKVFSPRSIYDDAAHSDNHPDVVASEWYTYKKRGLPSPFGVGTVDQSLLAVLGTRHVFVRLFGLAGKTVIVDEAHAYDTYMSELLERLLCWLGALGCSVVLLSATLPSGRREKLLHAYRQGAVITSSVESNDSLDPDSGASPAAPYPRVTWAPLSEAPVRARHVETSERSRKVIHVEAIDGRLPLAKGEPFVLGERLQQALIDGGCVAVICNTVRRARQVYRALKHYFPDTATDGQPELDLLHARYPFAERDRREKRALIRFGKKDETVETERGTETVCRPRRAVLVTTQIVEQSLDIDFDLMVTDIAPVDLVLQRTGRLWRHDRRASNGVLDRPQGMTAPTLWLCAPETKDGRPDFGPSVYVYDAHVLLRSWYHLRRVIEEGRLRVPDQVEGLVEAVYEEGAVHCPADVTAWGRYWRETWSRQGKDTVEDEREAEKRYIELPGYKGGKGKLDQIVGEAREEDSPESHPAVQALTRLTGLTVPIVLLHMVDGRLCADMKGEHPVNIDRKPSVEEAARLLKQSLTLSGFGVVRRVLECAVPSGWQKSALLRNHRALVLDTSKRARVCEYTLRLHLEEGLIVDKGSDMNEVDEEMP